MSVSILVSMLVAFTLTPTCSARVLKRKPKKPGHSTAHHGHGEPTIVERFYMRMLDWSLRPPLGHRHRLRRHFQLHVLSSTATSAATGCRRKTRANSASPSNCRKALRWPPPSGSTREIGRKIDKVPGVIEVIPGSSSGFIDRVTMGNITILLDPPDKRASLNDIATQIRAITREYAYARPALRFPNVLGGRDTFAPIRGSLLGPDFAKLAPIARDLFTKLLKEPSLADVRANLNFSNPELQVQIDRQLASDLGVRVSDVASAVRLLMSGDDEISTFKEGGEQYPVTMRLMPGQRDDPEVLARLLVPSATARPHPARFHRQTRTRRRPLPHRPHRPPVRHRHLRQRRARLHTRPGRRAPSPGLSTKWTCRRATAWPTPARSRSWRKPPPTWSWP